MIPASCLLTLISYILIRISIQFLKLYINGLKKNFVSLNFQKTRHIHFTTKNNPSTDMKIGYDDKRIPSVFQTKFLGINIDSTLSWRTHTEQLISKLRTSCYLIKYIKPSLSHTTLVMIYYTLFHSLMNYRLIFLGEFFLQSYFNVKKK
jgi:hypothetical protein